MGKRKKETDVFHIPDKKYTTDQKIISKMSVGALKDLHSDQEKYVCTLIEKVTLALPSSSTPKQNSIGSPTK